MARAADRPYVSAVRLLRDQVPDFSRYPYCVPAVASLDSLEFHPRATFLVGENGSGKSTLMEAIAVCLGLNPEGGSANFHFSTRLSHSGLSEHLRVQRTARRPRDAWFLRAESFFNVATEIEKLDAESAAAPRIIDSYGGRSLHEQSHGESFFALFSKRFGGDGIYLLDEPEAAMSPSRQLAFLSTMHQLIEDGSQFIIATHSPILFSYPDARVYEFEPHGISERRPEETEHFRVTRDFLNHPARMLSILLGTSQAD